MDRTRPRAPRRHMSTHRTGAQPNVIGVYDTIAEAETATRVLSAHGVAVDSISVVRTSAADAPPRVRHAVANSVDVAAVVSAALRRSADRRFADRRPPRPDRPTRDLTLAVVLGAPAETDRAREILADEAAATGEDVLV